VGDVVVTQPSAGVFKGFSATCTHKGCTVDKVADGTIDCPCHGSKFNLDGSVAHGPAQKPLQVEAITVQGDSIVLG
jgi:Rieske Fe-S protein